MFLPVFDFTLMLLCNSSLMWFDMFLKLRFIVESFITFIAPKPILTSVLWQMILKTFLCYKCFGTILTMIPYPFMCLHVVFVVVKVIKSFLTGVCSFRWNLAVFHRAGFHTSIVILWEKQSRHTRICTLTSKTSTPQASQ